MLSLCSRSTLWINMQSYGIKAHYGWLWCMHGWLLLKRIISSLHPIYLPLLGAERSAACCSSSEALFLILTLFLNFNSVFHYFLLFKYYNIIFFLSILLFILYLFAIFIFVQLQHPNLGINYQLSIMYYLILSYLIWFILYFC